MKEGIELEGKVLYEDNRIQISEARTPDEHNVLLDKTAYCYLPRGVLREWAEADSKRVESGLMAMNDRFLFELKDKGISLEYFGWTLSKARIKELEDEVGYFIHEAREAKDKR